ncbi:nonribosomal peptide synthetase MxaA [Xanthobacter sediminis]|uniref:nonribosomal peptide synthetase MxaA n=1 Tax=Xanthobacter sediminis TaxID=3119926 RepID=UPI00372735B1
MLAPVVAAADLTVRTPRAFGYVLGDTLTLEALIRLDPGTRLDPASVPQPHRVSSWLDLVAVDVTPAPTAETEGPFRLRMTYQSFYAALEPRALEIPAVTLTVRDAAARRELIVPPFRFVTSPLRELAPSTGGNPLALQPDIPPSPFPLRPEAERAGLAAAVLALTGTGLAVARGWRPFCRRRRPFDAAARAIRRPGAPQDAAAYLSALVALHRAFDETAGRRLLAEDIADFLSRAPHLAERQADVARLFEASRIAFFGAGAEAAMARLSPPELIALATRLAQAERQGPARIAEGAA